MPQTDFVEAALAAAASEVDLVAAALEVEAAQEAQEAQEEVALAAIEQACPPTRPATR